MPRYPRKNKLIKPALQLRLAAVFLCTALAATCVQALTLNRTVERLASYLPNDSELFLLLWPGFFRSSFLFTALLLALTVYLVGVTVTHKLFGPIHRFELYLQDLRDGKSTEPCRLRKGDDLQDFCALLNDATAPLRERAKEAEERRAA